MASSHALDLVMESGCFGRSAFLVLTLLILLLFLMAQSAVRLILFTVRQVCLFYFVHLYLLLSSPNSVELRLALKPDGVQTSLCLSRTEPILDTDPLKDFPGLLKFLLCHQEPRTLWHPAQVNYSQGCEDDVGRLEDLPLVADQGEVEADENVHERFEEEHRGACENVVTFWLHLQ